MATDDARKAAIDEETARKLLGEAREQVEEELKRVERDRANEVDRIADETAPEDDADLIEGKAADDRTLEDLRRRLDAIEQAEKRIEEGTYGLSVVSGDPIPKERLMAVPWAERTREEEER